MLTKREATAYLKWLHIHGHFVRQCPSLTYQENRICAMEMYWAASFDNNKLEVKE